MPNYRILTPCGASDVTITFPSTSGTLALSGAGLTGFIPSQNTAAPNNTVNASRLLVDAASTNADIVLQPKGTGAFLAQLPDNAATGGNKRGSYAVDLQMQRASGGQAALGANSVISGGANNTVGGQYGTISGGSQNSVFAGGTNATISGGTLNQSYGIASFVGGGSSNIASQNYAVIGGGISNQATQPYCSVVGGRENVAQSQYSVVAGGQSNNVSGGTHQAILCGFANGASGNYSSILNGLQCGAYGNYSAVLNGYLNYTNNDYTVVGGRGSSTRTNFQRAYSSYRRLNDGDCQQSTYHLAITTANATPTVMTAGAGAIGLANLINIPVGSTMTFHAIVTCREVGVSNFGGWIITGLADNTAGTITLFNVTSNLVHRTVGTWSATAVADSTYDAIDIVVSGSATNILWTATVNTILAQA